jgi:hypothetical protein
MLILIEHGAQWTGREPLGASSIWDLPWFLGVARRKLLWIFRTAKAEYIAFCMETHDSSVASKGPCRNVWEYVGSHCDSF